MSACIYMKITVCYKLDLPVAESGSKMLPSQQWFLAPGAPHFLAKVTIN